MKITFAGAAETVTGSCHLVEMGSRRVLMDCGMFQGIRSVESRNRKEFPFDPASVDTVVLSHAHLDHVGRLPLLGKLGFNGRILATSATEDITRLILLDSARIQASDANRARRKGLLDADDGRHQPLYSEQDVIRCLDLIDRSIKYNETVDLGDGIEFTLRDAGHVVGSAFIEMAHRSNGTVKRVAYTGDLGNVDKPIVCDPTSRVAPADAVIMESTYGQRDHRPFEETVAEIREIIAETFERRGTVVIPSFALERAQELLYVLHEMWKDGLLGKARIYLDSPMAIEVTHIVERHPECFDEEILELARQGDNPFGFNNLHYTHTSRASKHINDDRGPCIIVAASGMCTGGRILHHLRHRAPKKRNSLVFIGYQAVGTTGCEIVEGAPSVRIHGRDVDIGAVVHTVGGFSAHAGQETLLDWLGSAELPERVFLVHGEESGINGLRTAIKSRFGLDSYDPDDGETVEI